MNAAADRIWAFGGPLAGVPVETAWTIFAVALGLCVIFAWVSYRTSVVKLGVAPSALLMALRTAMLAALLFCLANPTRVERQTTKAPAPPPSQVQAAPKLAVVVDRSDSMTVADNRGRSRLDEALANWKRIEKAAKVHFGPTQYFSFAADLRPAKTLEEAVARTGGTSETRLYQSISTLLKTPAGEKPDALVVLTDGVDTSTDSDALLRDAAVAAGVPVYFVAGTNRSARPEPFLRVREWRVPPTALRNSEFKLEATFEAFSRTDRTVQYSVWQGPRRLITSELALTTGSNLVTRGMSVAVAEPGPVEFSIRLGPGDNAPIVARAMMHVQSPKGKAIKVLVYQSVLDWGLRYLSNALRTDPSFQFFTIVTPDAGLSLTQSTDSGGMMLGKLPDTLEPLKQFDCVVLVHPFPKRLSLGQQQTLVDFARNGGAVVLLSPDKEAMPQFAAGPLKDLLPVYLDEAGGGAGMSSAPEKKAAGRLTPFALTEAGKASPIFARAAGGGALLPRFMEYIPVTRVKPGAEILAVHPDTASAPTGQQQILLATQTFGRGRTAMMMTDALWRWKLDEPSDSRAIETFWQQLLLAVGKPHETPVLRFANVPSQTRVGQAVTVRLGGVSSEDMPVVVATSPKGKAKALVVKRMPDADLPWGVEWTPDEAGDWKLVAGIDSAFRASAFPSAVAEVTGELANVPPALDAMRALAADTGGALLAQDAPTAWRAEEKKAVEKEPEAMTSEQRLPEWNYWTVLWIALGAYALELVLRRVWKLV